MRPLRVSSVFFKAAAAIASVCLATSVHAVATASASLSNVRFTLIDLDPLDGITPWITFNSGVASQVEFKAEVFGADLPYTVINGTQPFGSVSGVINMANASTQGAVLNSAGSASNIASISATGSAANGWSFTNRVHAPAFPFGFTLSPKTSVRLEAQRADVSVGVSGTDGEETAEAEAALEIWSTDGNWLVRDDVRADAINLTDVDGEFLGQASAASKNALSVVLPNASANTLAGGLLASAYVWAQSDASAAAVPEPSSWALLLCGLAAMGYVRARRHG
jgi:hypothetical protein